MPRFAPGLLPPGLAALVLAGVVVAQRLLPATPLPEPPPVHDAAPEAPLPAGPTLLAAVGLPGVEALAGRIPAPWTPVPVRRDYVEVAMGDLVWDPDESPFEPGHAPEVGRPVMMGGHGDFHHLTHSVLERWIEPLGVPYTVVNFDAHDDMRGPLGVDGPSAEDYARRLDCGNWGRWSLQRLRNLQRIVQPGTKAMNETDQAEWQSGPLMEGLGELVPARPTLFYYSEPPALPAVDASHASRDLLASLTGRDAVSLSHPGWGGPEAIAARVPTRAVYVTVDLDVVDGEDFDNLEWGTGELSLDQIEESIRALAEDHVILGGDVTGFPPHSRVPGPWAYEKCLAAYARMVRVLYEVTGGTDWGRPSAAGAGTAAETGTAAGEVAP